MQFQTPSCMAGINILLPYGDSVFYNSSPILFRKPVSSVSFVDHFLYASFPFFVIDEYLSKELNKTVNYCQYSACFYLSTLNQLRGLFIAE